MRKSIIKLSYKVKGIDDLKLLEDYRKKFHMPLEEIEDEQLAAFKKLFSYCKVAIPYYTAVFSKLKLSEGDFKSLSDLEKIPVLTKNEIVKSWGRFVPANPSKNFFKAATGGSTGKPLKYRISQQCYSRGKALLYRDFGHASYDLGDKIVVLAGGSLVNKSISLKVRIKNKIHNRISLSSYGISPEKILEYYKMINRFEPVYLRGYASSIAYFAEFLMENNLTLKKKLKGIFSTAEVLGLNQRN